MKHTTKNLWCLLATLMLFSIWTAAQQEYAFGPVTSNGAVMGGTPGMITIRTNACPVGWTELTAWADKTILATTVAAGDAGTFGGSNSITPAGTNGTVSFTPAGTNNAPAISWPAGVPTHSGTAATFSGNALGTHAHELPLHGGTTPRITAGYGTGSSIAGTRSLTNAAQTTAQAVLLSQAVSAGTPAGTVNITNQGSIAWPAGVPTHGAATFTGTPGTVPAETFTGTAFDNRSAFVRVVFCSKN